jgi:threonine dehydrogenase-like Zn-dependent dehydrogenase
MRAVVTEAVGTMALREVPEPGAPPPGQVLVRPEAVGICGSDYHIYGGDLSEDAGGALPRIQGHEVGARIVAVGEGSRSGLEPGQLVALLPLAHCGECYPCSIGRTNACPNFQLIGVHVDGGLQDLLTLADRQVYPVRVEDPRLAALVEPISIAMRAVRRARVQAGERIVVLGAGPIGQGILLCARELGASVLLVDLQPERLELARELGAETIPWTDADETVARAREWAGGGGPPAVFDATGVPAAVAAMIELVSSAGRAAQVGLSGGSIDLRIGSLTEKELDLLGVTCCDAEDFAAAVALVERHPEDVLRLVSHEFALEQAHEAMRFAIANPTETMKVMIRGDER